MKHLRRYTALVCMFLVLCMLPAVAGAATLDKSELHFTVGVEGKGEVCVRVDSDEMYSPLGIYGFADDDKNPSEYNIKLIPGLEVKTTSLEDGAQYTFFGTPLIVGEYNLECKVEIFGIHPDKYSLWLKIIVHAKQDAPVVVDNVVYNAAPEHEQALIRGVREWCNVRAGAGTQSEIIGRANLGQQISLLRWNADESWCLVEFNGLQGWIAKQFILPIK